MDLKIRELNVDMIQPSTSNCMKPDQGGSKIVVIGKPGCFARGTSMLLRSGKVVPVEDVAVGHELVGEDGGLRTVTETVQGVSDMYDITYAVGTVLESTIRVNRQHMLTLWDTFRFATVDVPLSAFLHGQLACENFQWILIDFEAKFDGSAALEPLPTSAEALKGLRLRRLLCSWRFAFAEEEDEYFGFELSPSPRFLLPDGSVVHNTGKTTLITSLLYEKSHIFPIGMVMSGTEDSNGHYQTLFPSTFVFNALNEKKLEDFITRQKIAKMHVPNPWAILLLDDCTDDPKVLNKPLFQGLYKNGRHWKMLFILSLQYCMDIKPVVRTNIDGTFILRESSLRNRKTLWENYAGIIPDFGLFCAIMDQMTDNYTALYIHNATQSNKLEDCVFWYRAKPVPKGFKFGAPDFWRFHRCRFDPHYKESMSFLS